jgi:predicted branched-subunit amino acid permease
MGSASTYFWRGFRAQAPFLLGVLPYGLISGLAAVKLGAPALTAACMSFMVYAGASQLVAMDLFSRGAPPAVLLLAVLIVNLRMVIYSTALAPHLRGVNRGIRALLAYALTDQTFGVCTIEYDRMDREAARLARESAEAPAGQRPLPAVGDPKLKAWFYAGTVAVMLPAWVAASVVGAYVGAKVPESWGLDFAMPLMFTALVVPAMGRRGAIPAAVVGGTGGILLVGMPLGLGLITAALLGIAAGVFWEGWGRTHAPAQRRKAGAR